MLWYLADGSLNDYLKSQVALQGNYYSGQPTTIAQANFVSNTGLLTFEQLALANISSEQKNTLSIDQILVQLAPAQASPLPQKKMTDISKEVQHITVEQITINKLRFNITHALKQSNVNTLTNLAQLQHYVSQKLATDYPALYPDIAAKIYAEKHPELNAELVETTSEKTIKMSQAETNPAIIESKATKHKKRLLGKAATRITILAFTVKSFEISKTTDDGEHIVENFSNIALPVIGQEHGLASNQVGGEILRLLLYTANQLQQKK
jgi:hypothetical protein